MVQTKRVHYVLVAAKLESENMVSKLYETGQI